MAKPRTNYDAVQYWADSILADEPAPTLEVNSIEVSRDVVYSFGRHYPMGKIIRDERGRTRRVVLNSDYYPSRGFASTPTDQGNVHSCALDAVSKHRRKLELEFAPLSGYKYGSTGIPCKPKASDPALTRPYMEVPRVFHATDPGPEPVKSNDGCIAGTFEEYSYQSDSHVFLDLGIDQVRPWEWAFVKRYSIGEKTRVSTYKRTMHNGFIYWGVNQHRGPWGAPLDERWADFQAEHPGADIEYKRCPHCAAFAAVHDDWSARYHGGWSRRWRQGYKLYAEMIETYGSVEGWREAYRTDWRRVVSGRKYIAQWTERNHIPLSAVSTDADGIPILDENGHAMRKDSEAYFRKVRERERVQRRLQREAEDNARLRRRARRVIERRERRRAETFVGRADRVANELRALRLELAGNTTDGRES